MQCAIGKGEGTVCALLPEQARNLGLDTIGHLRSFAVSRNQPGSAREERDPFRSMDSGAHGRQLRFVCCRISVVGTDSASELKESRTNASTRLRRAAPLGNPDQRRLLPTTRGDGLSVRPRQSPAPTHH